ncbi:MAG TPA: type II secretion system protein [Candidatus Sulfotelmatobacter sp.]|nr:type II secretion system protein [Candidatus Sulfotelmatobacter sp.]
MVAQARNRLAVRGVCGYAPGIIYPILLLSIAIFGIATAAAAELWSTQMKRAKEEELLFRLAQFRTAIARYQADHNQLPKELKDLLVDSSQLTRRRYLRQIYKDPMTGKDDWVLKLLADRTGAVSGIQDIHSRSDGVPLKVLTDQAGTVKKTYQDW